MNKYIGNLLGTLLTRFHVGNMSLKDNSYLEVKDLSETYWYGIASQELRIHATGYPATPATIYAPPALAGETSFILPPDDGTTGYVLGNTDGAGSTAWVAPGAPADASYITRVAEAGLSNETAMGDLATGLVKNTTSTGIPSIAAAGTDYTTPAGSEGVSNKTITASTAVLTALSLIVGGFKAIFTHAFTADRTVTIPGDADIELVGKTTTQTITNKSIDSSQLTGNVAVDRIATALTTPGPIGGTTPDNITALQLRLAASTQLTEASDAITITQSYHTVHAQTGTADDLSTINGGSGVDVIILQAKSTDTVTVKNGTGNVFLNGSADFVLSGDKTLMLFYDGTNWSDVGASNTGATGADGRNSGIKYTYLTDTSVSDPGSGNLKFDSATLSSVTYMMMCSIDGDGNDITDLINSWSLGTSTVLGTMYMRKDANPSVFAAFAVTSSDDSGFGIVVMTLIVQSGTFLNGDTVKLEYSAAGNVGSAGTNGSAGRNAGTKYTYLTNTANSDPGSGNLKFDNTTLASITTLRISETDGDSNALAPWIATWDDSTSTIRGQFIMVDNSSASVFAVFNITGSNSDAGSYDNLNVSLVASNGSFSNGNAFKIFFVRTGDKGDTGAGVNVTTKGDLQGYDSAANRIPIGSNNTVMTADSTQALGLKWALVSLVNSITGILGLANGGTNADLSASGGTTKVLAQDASHVVTARDLIAVDIPSLAASKITSGALALARGGTNADLSASGGSTSFLAQDASHVVSARTIGDGDLPTVLAGHTITGGSLDNTPVGATTQNTGYFTTLKTKVGGFFATITHAFTADRTVTLPGDANVTLVGIDTTQTITNKSIDSSQLTGDVAVARIATALTTPGPIGGTTPSTLKGTSVATPIVAPTTDGSASLIFTKADLSTPIAFIDTTNSRVAIGLPSTQVAKTALDVLSPTADTLNLVLRSDPNSEGITNTVDRDFSGAGNWTGTNWAISSAKLKHAAGSTSDAVLTSTFLTNGTKSGDMSKVTFTVSGMTTGTLTPKLGTAAGTAITANGTYTQYIEAVAGAASLIFTPSSGFDGSIDDISLKKQTTWWAFGASIFAAATNSTGANLILDGVNGRISTKRIIGIGGAPTIAAGAGAGTGPTVSLTGASDIGFIINVTTGTLPTAAAVVATITLNSTFGNAPKVLLTPGNAATALLTGATMVYATSTTTTVVVNAGATGLVAATAYVWNCFIYQ